MKRSWTELEKETLWMKCAKESGGELDTLKVSYCRKEYGHLVWQALNFQMKGRRVQRPKETWV